MRWLSCFPLKLGFVAVRTLWSIDFVFAVSTVLPTPLPLKVISFGAALSTVPICDEAFVSADIDFALLSDFHPSRSIDVVQKSGALLLFLTTLMAFLIIIRVTTLMCATSTQRFELIHGRFHLNIFLDTFNSILLPCT